MGRKKVNKHVQLAMAIKRKTGSVSVIRWLNRYGHSISYDELNAVETKLAEDQIHDDNFRKYLPNNIQKHTFVTFVYANCDHNTESIYNSTLHATNGIIIQRYNTFRYFNFFTHIKHKKFRHNFFMTSQIV